LEIYDKIQNEFDYSDMDLERIPMKGREGSSRDTAGICGNRASAHEWNVKMKIAMFGHKRMPSREGGVEVVVEALSTRMAAKGHQVTCYNRGGRHVSGAEFGTKHQKWDRGVRLIRVPTLDIKGLAAVTSSFFAALVCAFSDAQVVHIHGEGPAAMCWLPRLFGKKVVVTIHGLDWQREKWKQGFGAKYIRWGEKMAVRRAHEIIVLSEQDKRYFLEQYGRETVYIPNGVTEPKLRPVCRIRERYGLEKDGYILFLGRLVPEKGIHYLIEAYKQLKTDKRLVIAGGCSDTAEYVRRLKALAGDDPYILFTGFVQGAILEELFSNAWVYVLPSDLEGMPLSLLEAMSYGNCCLVSDIPACREVAGDCALTFPRGDVNALASCLQALQENSDAVAAMKNTASEHICRKYSWEEITDKTLELYR